MKNRILLSAITVFTLFSFTHLSAQPQVWQVHFCYNGGNIRANPLALDSINANIPSAGQVVVHFDGSFTATPGDLIVLAASDSADWASNDGNLSLEVASDIANTRSFSHTRAYSVAPGVNTFYAVVQNYVQTDGAGTIDICGSLTVEFFPTSGTVLLSDTGIQFSGNVRGAPFVVADETVTAPDSGQVQVHFDGYVVSDSGDVITLAANDTGIWYVNANIAVAAINSNDDNGSPISQTQIFSIGAGTDTFDGVAQNYVVTGGDGSIYVYGNLTSEFFPSSGGATVTLDTVASLSAVNVRPGPVAFDSVTLNVPDSGYALVEFDGNCSSTVGDLILLAASNNKTLGLHDSSVAVQAVDDVSSVSSYFSNCFSHSRLYEVTPGNQTFYALAENSGNTSGSGSIFLYTSLTVKYYPGLPTTGINNPQQADAGFEVYPNPANNMITVILQGGNSENTIIELMDLTGRSLQRIECGTATCTTINLSSLASGMYFIRANGMVKQVVKE